MHVQKVMLFGIATVLLASQAMLSADEAKVSGTPSAAAMMQAAHDGRMVWNNFPGFTARVRCTADGSVVEGQLKVKPDGSIELDLPKDERFAWAEKTLDSVAGHRLPNGDAETNVEFADDQEKHPGGRLIRSKGEASKNLWRVQGDLLTEVQRTGKDSRFIISVTDVWRTPEGKHLPRDFVVTTWALPSQQIKSVRQVHNEWKRVGGFDLPSKMLAITNTSDGKGIAQQIEFFDQAVSTASVAAKP